MDVEPSRVWPSSAIKVSYPDAAGYNLPNYPSHAPNINDMAANNRLYHHHGHHDDERDVPRQSYQSLPGLNQPSTSSTTQHAHYYGSHPPPYSVPASATNGYNTSRLGAVPPVQSRREGRLSPKHHDSHYAPNAAALYAQASAPQSPHLPESGSRTMGGTQFVPMASMPRLPPILQVEKQQVTTSATQAASASRRRNEAHFVCPVPGCGSTFTRRFNLRGHLRSHTEERPYVCEWPGCGKGFARQHDCKRHQALHTQRSQSNVCQGCSKTFSRLDALNRHLRSDGGADCRQAQEAHNAIASANHQSPNSSGMEEDWDRRSASADQQSSGRLTPQRNGSLPPATQAQPGSTGMSLNTR